MNFTDDTDSVQRSRYARRVQATTRNSRLLRHILASYLTGGLLCVLAQLIMTALMTRTMLDKESASGVTTIAMIAIGILLTGLGIYDRIYTFGGAGAAVPVTGFANSVASPAMEFKKEGWISGMGARIFSLAGPVLVYGISAASLVGLIYYLTEVMGS